MGLGGNLLLTQLAWTAGHKAMSYLPKKWQNRLAGRRDDATLKDFLVNNRQKYPEIVQILSGNETIFSPKENKQVKVKDLEGYTDDGIIRLTNEGKRDWFYVKANDPESYGGAGYVCMYLRVQGTDTIMEIPCVDGCPEIDMQVVQNEMPTATNEIVTTNRRVKPLVFRFRFPVAYLRIYGENDSEVEAEKIELSIKQKAFNKAKQKWNDLNPFGYDMALTKPNEVRQRTIPTYAQVLGQLIQFPRQFGCYLYMGFGFTKLGVTCSMKLSSQKGDMDCIWVDMTLTETMEFDFNKLESTSVADIKNNPSTQSVANGKQVADNTQSVS